MTISLHKCCHTLQNNESESILSCYVCHLTESSDEKCHLRKFSDSTWTTIKHVAALRKNLKSDKYLEVTQTILASSDRESLSIGYHASCHKSYTAVKRAKEDLAPDDEFATKIRCTETRRSSAFPKSDGQGILKGTCIFCSKSRKKKNGKDEPRLKVATIAGCESLYHRAKFSKNEHIKSLVRSGVDLIAKEAEYHKSCRVQFLKDTDKQETPMETTSSQSCHKMVFASLLSFIQDEVFAKHRTIFVSDLLAMYKEEYASIGESGTESDVPVYIAQNLSRKIKDHLKDRVTITLVNQRKGNCIHSSDIPEEEAHSRLHEDSKRYEENIKLRWAALHLRSQIIKLPKTRTPNLATVQTLKECAPEMPEQLDLFLRSLLGGITPILNGTQKDILDQKVTAMGSDAISGFKIAAGCRLQPAFSGHLPAIFKQERQCFFRISVIDSEQETIYSVEDDPFDCGMGSSSEAESD